MKKVLGWIAIIFVVLIVIGMFAGGGEESTETASSGSSSGETAKKEEAKKEEPKEEAKKEFGVGQEVAVENISYIVNSIEEQKELKMEYMDTLTTDGKFVIVDLTVKNNDKEARFIDTEMLRLVDAEGTEFSSKTEADMYINGSDLGFFLSEVNPKMSKTGKVAFEVPADVTELKLQVSSGFGWSGGEYEVINLK